MFNFLGPYLPLIYLALVTGVFGGGVSVGYKWAEGTYTKAAAEALRGAVETARADVATESKAALAVAKANAARRADAAATRNLIEKELAKDEIARNCRVSDGTFRMLSDSIDNANGNPPKALRGDGAKPSVPETGESVSGGFGKGLTGWFRGVWSMPSRQESSDRMDRSSEVNR